MKPSEEPTHTNDIRKRRQTCPIAVVGMGCIFPDAPSPEAFWKRILEGRCSSEEVPEHRWDVCPDAMTVRPLKPDRAVSKKACLVKNFIPDLTGFEIPESYLQSLDPLYHFVLHAGRQAAASARLETIDPSRIQVVLAAIALPTDTASRFSDHFPWMNTHPWAGRVTGYPAVLLARAMGFCGEAYTIDAACASSLYALYLGAQALADHRADAVLAGGVSRPDSLYTQVGFSQLRALSPSGVPAPFSTEADGLVVGEGAGIFLLKRLSDARKAGDRILAVIRGIGLSNDTRGNLLAPDTEGQLRAMQAAYAAAGWQPDDVDLIECHGAGTPVGDGVEIESLKRLWASRSGPPGRCPIGSVKSTIGHLLTAAGAAALTKTILAMTEGVLPPTLNVSAETAHRALLFSPFRLQLQPEPWPRRHPSTPRRAAVSAFGFGGINAHVLIEEDMSALQIDATPIHLLEPEFDPPKHGFGPIAIVGMGASVAGLPDIPAFQEHLFRGKSAIIDRPDLRCTRGHRLEAVRGGFIERLRFEASAFRIPPIEIDDILVQHLVMLEVARKAIQDAGLELGKEAMLHMGVVVGMDFDREACDFHGRWTGSNHAAAASVPPLTATRTLGALGGIIASRIAREFGCGGPSFTVSEDALSGFRALSIAADLLFTNETDCMMIAAVDMFADVRSLAIAEAGRRFARELVPFSVDACGTLPGEGAGALVLKRYEDARRDGNRIYAVIRGIGTCCGTSNHPATTYERSLRQCLTVAAAQPDSVDLVCAHASADPAEDRMEADALGSVFKDHPARVGIVSEKPVIGHTGSASAMVGLILSSLSLHHRLIPPMAALPSRVLPSLKQGDLHIPHRLQYWTKRSADHPRRTVVCAIGMDAQTGHVLLEEAQPLDPQVSGSMATTALSPAWGLFVVSGESKENLLTELGRFQTWLSEQPEDLPIASVARAWLERHGKPAPKRPCRTALLAEDRPTLIRHGQQAQALVQNGTESRLIGPSRIAYLPRPVSGRIAFVYPGSGNHFLGMMHTLAAYFPDVFEELETEDCRLFDGFLPERLVPWRIEWPKDWERETRSSLSRNPVYPIIGQVMFGCGMSRILGRLGLRPDAVIGYSLGESTGLFATGAWKDRSLMLSRMLESPLFTTELAGPCHAVRTAWGIGPDEPFEWTAVGLRCPAETIRKHLMPQMRVRLLIVNTPEECVIGGNRSDVEAIVHKLGCDAFDIEAVSSVHCDAVSPVAAAYRDLHLLPTTPPVGIRYYSAAWAKAYEPSADGAADSITAQALSGFDFPALIRQAWEDGIRIFIEVGPHGSCSRMIDTILKDREHGCGFANWKGEDELLGILKLCGNLAVMGLDPDLRTIYRKQSEPRPSVRTANRGSSPVYRERVPGIWKTTPQASGTDSRGVFSPSSPRPLFERSQCMEFAVGSIAGVLGPAYAVIDTFPVRVRLPDEPLMLVDRILTVEGEPRSLGSGRVVTEHDVLPDAWYLDAGRAPVCISVEAGQADLFLCSWLGIDFQVRGERVYRLLDAEVTFFRELPQPGETIRYDIRIEKFIRQAKTWMFFFGFDGTIDGKPFIRMRRGCAGFFTPEEIEASGGILLSDAEQVQSAGNAPGGYRPLRSRGEETCSEDQIEALRRGDPAGCFGNAFEGIRLSPGLHLPSGRMRLIDRVPSLDPAGGRFGLGRIVAEADIHPNDWFLTCHFMDDPVMPGTLMYECCSHALRVLLLRQGWMTEHPEARFEPLPGACSVLKCRGPVTPKTRKVRYDVQISEIGFSPEPYVLAEADMFADGKHIVRFTGVSMRLMHAGREDIETVQARIASVGSQTPFPSQSRHRPSGRIFDRSDIEAFSMGGAASAIFGNAFAPVDDGRFVARLPAPPFLFLDRVVTNEAPGLGPRIGSSVTAEYDVDPNAWYVSSGGCGCMPYAVLQETALQTCGFLAAHCGSALSSDTGLHFRNLGGRFRLFEDVLPRAGRLTMRASMIQVSAVRDMVIERFETRIVQDDRTVLEGETEFGFFTKEALRAQAGIRKPAIPAAVSRIEHLAFVPIEDMDSNGLCHGLQLPQPMFRMIDAVCCDVGHPGAFGLGVWVGICTVRPDAWFFKAHFHEDPVWPGSLGLEAFLQVLRCGMLLQDRVPAVQGAKRRFRWTIPSGKEHGWTYRGQILPGNGRVRVEAHIKTIETEPIPMVTADGFLEVDGLRIYEMTDFSVGVVEENG
ncbi:MAG: beta-ketoacyl synthase N-terminal-like domain-containing protein [Thermodesulfobacteriota bacterium]